MTFLELSMLTLAAAGAGAINALAGGGTLISFPVLLACGVPPIVANVTNAVALCPGYFGATLAQRRHLAGQRRRLYVLVPAALMGGVIGALILVRTRERTFLALVPYMLLLAARDSDSCSQLRPTSNECRAGPHIVGSGRHHRGVCRYLRRIL